jgi:hypothetical protein
MNVELHQPAQLTGAVDLSGVKREDIAPFVCVKADLTDGKKRLLKSLLTAVSLVKTQSVWYAWCW